MGVLYSRADILNFPHELAYEKLTRDEFIASYNDRQFAHIRRLHGQWYWAAWEGEETGYPLGERSKEDAAKAAFLVLKVSA